MNKKNYIKKNKVSLILFHSIPNHFYFNEIKTDFDI